ncbi:sensor domain-containing protein [Spirillospora albida]|uniref:sensor domain-containing protein n=1 Tax=Spirillospora albida TaxID=58123 RepID=UPI0012F92B18|nr:sensor domain-containing protein [Spirillospora albida]
MNGGVAVVETRYEQHVRTPMRGFALVLLSIPTLIAEIVFVTVLSLFGALIGVALFPAATKALRGLLDVHRDLVGRWTGVPIERPYRPAPAAAPGAKGLATRVTAPLKDPATWRDQAWALANPIVATFTGALAFWAVVYGLWGYILAAFAGRVIVDLGGTDWYAWVRVDEGYAADPSRLGTTLAIATGFLAFGFLAGPKMMDAYGRWTRTMLGR